MYRKGFGVKFITMISKEQDKIKGLVFVDDSDLPEGNLKVDTEDINNIAKRIQEAINT